MEEKNFDLKSFIGFALIGGILLYMMSQNKSIPDEIVEKQQQKAQFEDLNIPNNSEEYDNETVFSKQNSKLGEFKYSSETNFETDNITVIENKFLKLKINNKGGMLEEVKLKAFVNHDSLPIFLIKDGNSQFNLNFTTSTMETNRDNRDNVYNI
jgi:YidC/Oxa1 family membrane protein insertase